MILGSQRSTGPARAEERAAAPLGDVPSSVAERIRGRFRLSALRGDSSLRAGIAACTPSRRTYVRPSTKSRPGAGRVGTLFS